MRIFVADIIECIELRRDEDGLLEGVSGRTEVQEGELKADGAVEIIEKVTPAIEDSGFIIVLRKLVVDVLELDGFCEE